MFLNNILKLLSPKVSTNRRRIYMDNAAATPLDPKVKDEMDRFWNIDFGNSGTIYREGVVAKKTLEDSRKKVASLLNASGSNILFTSGGTESNNLAIFGLINYLEDQGINLADLHIITSVMEHPSVLNCFKELEKKGVDVDYLGINENGIIDIKDVKKNLRSTTILVSIMYANNEIGTIQPISKISRIIDDYENSVDLNSELEDEVVKMIKKVVPKIIFHTDASQAPLYLDIDTKRLGVDLMTIDGQKIYGPKGIGVLYIDEAVKLKPIFMGGGQEGSLRPGTENIPLIVGLAKALEIADKNREEESVRLSLLRDYFIDRVLKEIVGSGLNGDKTNRLPNNINISIPKIDNEFAIIQLDEKGIACSAKSACLGSVGRGSYVVEALGKDQDYAKTSLRFSLGKMNTKEDIDYVVDNLIKITEK